MPATATPPVTSAVRPFFPIVYVRGYAGTQQDVEDTVADPFMGFNLGSSKIRQRWSGEVQRHYFESPLVRLMKDYSYRDAYCAGQDMPPDEKRDPRTIFIYRYYDCTSSDFGDGRRLGIADAAKGLSELILKVRDFLCQKDAEALAAFRVYLVAHSMGGLICRCFLQNRNAGDDEARKLVDKVFTYATPHNGIDLELIGNVPGFLSLNDANNFNRARIAEYLALDSRGDGDVSSLDGKFDPGRFFNLVGTNERDYQVASGLSRKVVGPMSDGLVRITNATTWGPPVGKKNGAAINSPRAFVYRSHSGYYGIVNSEEGYQNLKRFFFGNIRATGVLKIEAISLPPEIQAEFDKGKKVRASYHIEVILRVRGQPWDLHRRITDENSAIFRKYDELVSADAQDDSEIRHPTLFSAFLWSDERVDSEDQSLGFSIDIGVLVPQYEVDGLLWFKNHYEGGYLYRHKINLEATPPKDEKGSWTVKYGLDSESPNDAPNPLDCETTAEGIVFRVPITQDTKPGIKAELEVTANGWNQER